MRLGFPGDSFGAVEALRNAVALKHGILSKAAVGESDLDSALRPSSRGGSLPDPTLKTASVVDRLLELGATPAPRKVRLLTSGEPAVAAFAKDGRALKVYQATLEAATFMVGFKCGALSVVSNESLANSSIDAMRLVTECLRRGIDDVVNAKFLDPTNDGNSGEAPPAITYGATTIDSAGTSVQNIGTDFNAALRSLAHAGSDLVSAVGIMHTITAAHLSTMVTAEGVRVFPDLTPSGGRAFGIPIIVSGAVADSGASPLVTNVVVLDASDVLIALEDAVVGLSSQSAVEMSDSPTGATDTPVAATSLVSLFQAEATAVKVTRIVDWKSRRGLVRVIEGVDY